MTKFTIQICVLNRQLQTPTLYQTSMIKRQENVIFIERINLQMCFTTFSRKYGPLCSDVYPQVFNFV